MATFIVKINYQSTSKIVKNFFSYNVFLIVEDSIRLKYLFPNTTQIKYRYQFFGLTL